MALARRFEAFGGNHPRSTFLGGILVGGLGAVVGVTLAVAAISETGSTVDRSTPLGTTAGSSYLDDADGAARVVISTTDRVAVDAARTEVQAAPRVLVGSVDAAASSLSDEWSALVERAQGREVRYGVGVGAAATESEGIWREALANEAAAAYRHGNTGADTSVLPPPQLDQIWRDTVAAQAAAVAPVAGVGSPGRSIAAPTGGSDRLVLTPEVAGFLISEGQGLTSGMGRDLTTEEAAFIASEEYLRGYLGFGDEIAPPGN